MTTLARHGVSACIRRELPGLTCLESVDKTTFIRITRISIDLSVGTSRVY